MNYTKRTTGEKVMPDFPEYREGQIVALKAIKAEAFPQYPKMDVLSYSFETCPKAELLCVRDAPPHPVLRKELQKDATRVVGSKYKEWPICPRHEIPLHIVTVQQVSSRKSLLWAVLKCEKKGMRWDPRLMIGANTR